MWRIGRLRKYRMSANFGGADVIGKRRLLGRARQSDAKPAASSLEQPGNMPFALAEQGDRICSRQFTSLDPHQRMDPPTPSR